MVPNSWLLRYRCNLCGQECETPIPELEREKPSCPSCRSTPRFRAVISVLSLELFGESLALPAFPTRKDIRGLGLSDWDGYALELANKLDYRNTFYDREPKLDITRIDPALEGTLDFLISSEVFEHVPPPVSLAFENARRLLKDNGVLVLTVPFTMEGETSQEHFPNLYKFRVVEREDGRRVLINTTRSGEVETFEDLCFHQGSGLTLEMRLFSEASLSEELRRAGFSYIKVFRHPDLAHGVFWSHPEGSLPIAARRRQPHRAHSGGAR